jgi:hypothetical protein
MLLKVDLFILFQQRGHITMQLLSMKIICFIKLFAFLEFLLQLLNHSFQTLYFHTKSGTILQGDGGFLALLPKIL